MTVRKATEKDTIRIIRAIQNKRMDYNTPADVREDVKNGVLFVAVFYKPHRGYYAITRGCVYSKKSRGKGVASALVDYILSLDLGVYGATPWNDNPAMCHIFEKRGFVYQYTFKENYKFYKKSA